MSRYNGVTRLERDAMVLGWLESGLSQPKYAKLKNVSFYKLNYWINRYHKNRKFQKPKGFIKLPAPEKKSPPENIFSEIIFANGNRLLFYNAVEISQLKQIAS